MKNGTKTRNQGPNGRQVLAYGFPGFLLAATLLSLLVWLDTGAPDRVLRDAVSDAAQRIESLPSPAVVRVSLSRCVEGRNTALAGRTLMFSLGLNRRDMVGASREAAVTLMSDAIITDCLEAFVLGAGTIDEMSR